MESNKNNRITLYIIVLLVFVLVTQSSILAQPPGSRSGRGGGDMSGGGDMFGGGGRGGDRGDRGDMFGGGGRGSGGLGRGGMSFQDENATDAQIDRIIKMYSLRHSQQETQTLEEQRKTLSREQFIRALRQAAFFEYMDVMSEEREYREILEWCEKFTPDEAKGIRELKDENYDMYKKRLDPLADKYRLLRSRRNVSDELMHVLVSDQQLEFKQRDLTMQYWTTTDQVKKDSISTDLKDVISKRYDLIVQQKKIQYTDFQERLKRLQESIDAQLKDIKTWEAEDFKAKEVDTQVRNLTTTPSMFRRSPFDRGRPIFMPPYQPSGMNTIPEVNSIPEPNK